MTKKKKLLYHSDFIKSNTGFGKAAKNLLTYLYKTGKYEIVHYCCGVNYSNPELQVTPWKTVGCLPDNGQETQNYLNSFPQEQREFRWRQMNYGDYLLDKVILEEKPDVYIVTNDIWGQDFAVGRFWFDKITSVLSTTLDSRPLLKSAIDVAPKVKNYWMWSSFAEKDMHKLGHTHVKTVHGAIDTRIFYRLPDTKRKEIRKQNNLPEDAFIIGFVFRNQLRKQLESLIEGYAIWKKSHKEKSYLLLNTCASEGWPIHELAQRHDVSLNEILLTHVCKQCRGYEVKPFTREHVDCSRCGVKGNNKPIFDGSGIGQVTTSVAFGVSDSQLNEVYNLMDVYCHPISSGGQEIPIQEAKLTELVTLVTNYSCGEEACEDGAGSLPLEWTKFIEFGTSFIKSSTTAQSIADNIEKVYKMTPTERLEMGKIGRKWVLNGFSIESVGRQVEEFLDSCPFADYSFVEKEKALKNPDAPIQNLENDHDFILHCYSTILSMNVDEKDSGYQHWATFLKQPQDKHKLREHMVNCFRNAATEHNKKHSSPVPFDTLLDQNGKKRLLIVLKESAGDVLNSTSLFESFRESYPEQEWDIYFACLPQFFDLLSGNPYVKVLPYQDFMESEIACTGVGTQKGLFNAYTHLGVATQCKLSYLTNSNIGLRLSI